MILVYLWLPFIFLGACVGLGMHYPGQRDRVVAAGLNPDRFVASGLILGLFGPIALTFYLASLVIESWRAWVKEGPPPLPPGAVTLGAQTPEDCDRLCEKVRAGEIACFIGSYKCPVCGDLVGHVDTEKRA